MGTHLLVEQHIHLVLVVTMEHRHNKLLIHRELVDTLKQAPDIHQQVDLGIISHIQVPHQLPSLVMEAILVSNQLMVNNHSQCLDMDSNRPNRMVNLVTVNTPHSQVMANSRHNRVMVNNRHNQATGNSRQHSQGMDNNNHPSKAMGNSHHSLVMDNNSHGHSKVMANNRQHNRAMVNSHHHQHNQVMANSNSSHPNNLNNRHKNHHHQ